MAKRLEAARQSAKPRARARSTKPKVLAGGIIVVVEDDANMRRTVTDILEACGHTVIPADGGAHAVALCKSFQGKPDLLLSDFVMPEMDGGELITELERAGALPRVLLMTGYPLQELGDIGSNGRYPVLSKPFTPADLARRVGELMAQPTKRQV